jgi:hypothetical protein
MTISTRRIEPPPHLLKQWVQAAREAEKKGGPYAKTFAMAAIDWALNSQPTPNDRQIRSSEITPPPELVRKWQIKIEYCSKRADREAVVAQLFQLGADMELEACCEWFVRDWTDIETADTLRAARRPKPPSLKEQALAALDDAVMRGDCMTISDALPTIRRALEQLDD